MDKIFPGYNELTAPADDQLRIKWNGVRQSFARDNLPMKLNSADLDRANISINGALKYVEEPDGQDIWQTPLETLMIKRGDCEDYAILKYRLLMDFYPEENLRLIIGNISSVVMKSGFVPHAWLAVYSDDHWNVLDSKFNQIIKPKDYINWVPVAGCHQDTVVIYGKEITLSDWTHKDG